ncbi:MAG: hypothetical protein RL693_2212 [Verrucomicrobiota bacterium]|jgi:phosphatidylglycerol:prolipoprotein diacylglycerol transferase
MNSPEHWSNAISNGPYRWTMLIAIALSALYWWLRSRRDPALLPIYIGALGGAFIGAKLLYLLAEGWHDWPMPDRWLRLATGKTVLGGLLGGFVGVEFMKWLTRYPKATGDKFALIVPLGIALGRVGCLMQGCCLGNPTANRFLAMRDHFGVSRWPSVPLELGFQLLMFVVLVIQQRQSRCTGRLFYLYLMAYGAFRFFHEWLRETPKVILGISVYQLTALLLFALGAAMWQRRKPLVSETS